VKSAVETLNPTRVKLTVEVPFDELRPSLDAAYRTIGNQVTVPGFRKGKIPPRIIDQRFGSGVVLEEAVNQALPEFYAQAVEESDVRPLGQPQVDVVEVPDPSAGGELRFTAEVDVRPEITLPSLEGIAVSVESPTVTEEDVDSRLESLRERFGTLTALDRPAAADDFVVLDIAARIGDEEIDSVKGVSYQVGSGTMLPGLDEAVTDLSAGESTSFTTALAGGEHAGEEATVEVTVQAVKERQLPAADDDFAQLASEFDTIKELRADLRAQVERVKRLAQGLQARERVLEHLLESVEIPVPEGLLAEEVGRHLETEGHEDHEGHTEEVEAETRTALKSQLLLDAIAESLQVSVAQQELVEYVVASAQQYGMDPNDFAKAMERAGQVPAMVGEVARRKALAAVLSKAVITDDSGAPVDLNALFARAQEPAGDGREPAPSAAAPTPVAADPSAVSVPVFDFPAEEE